MGTLNAWEFEWYKALHFLRDGTQLRPDPVSERVNRQEAEERLKWLRRAKPTEILGDMLRWSNPPPFSELSSTDERARTKREFLERERQHLKEFAEMERQGEISELERYLKPKKIYAAAERRGIWDELISAQTVPEMQNACRRWESLLDVRGFGTACFAAHVSTNAEEFLRMKRKRNRFPQSSYADESRLEHLARGMAGVMVGVSPMTAIERLRNMKHDTSGPLWSAVAKCCECWRCRLRGWRGYYRMVERAQVGKGESKQ
jgi:hypothetical protein